ncbi:MAG: DeoR/GlpR family DNA-binding transcription regulator [Propionibacteriaceae bacterium]|nr:DeoR/GlpR family DNA-binding transcription regulator [Propionibacteriaceae bacterium]
MLKEARLQAILDHLRTRQVESTAALGDALGVSAATIRRDLDELVASGLVTRVFGGAKLTTPEAVDEPFDEVLPRNSEAKRSIAHIVADQLQPGSTVFLEAGTTCWEVAMAAQELELTVVTNSLRITELLLPRRNIELILLGGTINREYLCTQGASAVAEIRNLLIDVAVVGCSGVGERHVLRDTSQQEREVKRALRESSSRLILAADHGKFPGIGAHTALDLTEIDLLVTDRPLTPPWTDPPTKVLHP